jgi:hypothetical protein
MRALKYIALSVLAILLSYSLPAQNQTGSKPESFPAFISAPDSLVAGEQFELTFTIQNVTGDYPSVQWYPDSTIEILWGPQVKKKATTIVQNGQSIKSYDVSFTFWAVAQQSEPLSEHIGSFESERSSSDTSTDFGDSDISSIGPRTNGSSTLKYASKSKVVTNIKGWCYNTETGKWVGKQNFIHCNSALDKPDMFAQVCFSIQMCKYSDSQSVYYVIKWSGVPGLSHTGTCYIILNEEEFNTLRNVDASGQLLWVSYSRPLEPADSDNAEIRKVLGDNMTTRFGVRLDGDVIRFNHGDDGEFGSVNGMVDFRVKSDKYSIHGYFEMSKSDWSILFNL